LNLPCDASIDSTSIFSTGFVITNTFGDAIAGYSQGFGTGVFGESLNGAGVSGFSTNGDGVHGKSTSGTRAGVWGENTDGYGVHGTSQSASGVFGVSTSGVGVYGISSSASGLYGISSSASGIFGQSTSGVGVSGDSDSGDGIYGISSSGTAGTFLNNGGNKPALVAVTFGTGPALSITGGSPALQVSGTAKVRVLEITGGADVAERFEVSEAAQPGMVVAIDPQHPGSLRIARGAYNRRVAGVISGANQLEAGMVLADVPGAKNALPVALSGRVWVNTDATKRAIASGDLLTTADRPGYAMKVTDYTKAQGDRLHEGPGSGHWQGDDQPEEGRNRPRVSPDHPAVVRGGNW